MPSSLCQISSVSTLLPGLLTFFITFHICKVKSALFTVVGPDQPITAIVGEEIVLPCRLAPNMSAKEMEVRWFRSEFRNYVHLYRDGRDLFGGQMPKYKARTAFWKGGLTDGNVSLRILNIGPSDEGRYRCLVNDDTTYEEAIIELKVAVLFFPRVNPWMVALSVILVVVLSFTILNVYLFKIKGNLQRELGWKRAVICPGLGQTAPPLEKEEVTLDPDTAHPELILSEDGKSVRWTYTWQDLPNNPERFETERCVLGHEGFTSGRHWWEVQVGKWETWAMGVARESVRRKGGISFTPKEGIWAVQCDWDLEHRKCRYKALTAPDPTPLSLDPVPSRVGIYLDCTLGRVWFLDADTGAPIFTFPPASFTGGRIRPWFFVRFGEIRLRLCQ